MSNLLKSTVLSILRRRRNEVRNVEKAKATCTWGDGPDVIFVINTKLIAHANAVGSFDLTSKEARSLAFELNNAAEQAEELERISKQEGL